MPGFPLDAVRRAKAVRFLLLGWRPDQIAREIYCEVRTIYRMRNNIWMFDSPCKPHYRKIGRPRDITIAARGGLLLYLMWFPIASQDEMAWFLWEEYGISVNRSTVSRELKRVRWSKKKAARISHHRSQQIRRDYTVEMAGITAEQMVVLDETLFNESTGWRSMAWSPIGMPARYIGSRRRGVSWSLLAAYARHNGGPSGVHAKTWPVMLAYIIAN
jgi:transposase